MSKYELMYIIDASLEEGPRKELIEKVNTLITSHGGEVEKVDEWGKRRLAYPINYKNDGYYVLINFASAPDLPIEIERVLQISDSVLRYLVIKLEQKQTSVKPRPVSARPVFGRPAPLEAAESSPETAAEAEASAPKEEAATEPAEAAEPAAEAEESTPEASPEA